VIRRILRHKSSLLIIVEDRRIERLAEKGHRSRGVIGWKLIVVCFMKDLQYNR
jgi:hypothetical protein